jgi:hypothetical protein
MFTEEKPFCATNNYMVEGIAAIEDVFNVLSCQGLYI